MIHSRLLLPTLAACALWITACSRNSPSADERTLPAGRDAQVSVEPEPVGAGFKTIGQSCAEPVVRILSEPRDHFDSVRAEELVRSLVRDTPELGSEGIHYAEADVADRRLLLARCPNAEIANRLARRVREKDKSGNAVPLCGYASSGWTHAVRRVSAR